VMRTPPFATRRHPLNIADAAVDEQSLQSCLAQRRRASSVSAAPSAPAANSRSSAAACGRAEVFAQFHGPRMPQALTDGVAA